MNNTEMTKDEKIHLLKTDVMGWNKYRANNNVVLDLSGADLFKANLSNANLNSMDLSYTNLHGANLHKADLSQSFLTGSDLGGAYLHNTIGNMREVHSFGIQHFSVVYMVGIVWFGCYRGTIKDWENGNVAMTDTHDVELWQEYKHYILHFINKHPAI